MTVQTFEEYAKSVGMSVERGQLSGWLWPSTAVAHHAWQAAHENAAKVADDLFCGYHSPYEYEKDVAEAIREAARGG